MSKQADEDKTLASQPPDATVDLRRQSRAFARKTEQSKSAPATEGDAETTVIEPGDEVDHFKVQRLLGRGGMGEVHLARDMKLGRKVALKLIHRRALGNTVDAVQRFLLEARMTAKFSHPNIITVYAVGEHEGVPYLALEYLRGQTLRDRMGGERYSPRETARIGLAIAQALAEAHRHRVLHRDLKPDNVLVPPDGRLRVVDFGLARQNEGSPAISERAPLSDRAPLSEPPGSEADVPVMPDVSDEGLVGTPRYMAP